MILADFGRAIAGEAPPRPIETGSKPLRRAVLGLLPQVQAVQAFGCCWLRWHCPKPPLYRLDTLYGKAPKVRRFGRRKTVGNGESHGAKSVNPSSPRISLLWDGADEKSHS